MIGSRSVGACVCVAGRRRIACRSDEGGQMRQSFWTISPFSQAEIQDAAASLIAAAWRMAAQRRRRSERVVIALGGAPTKIHKKLRRTWYADGKRSQMQ